MCAAAIYAVMCLCRLQLGQPLLITTATITFLRFVPLPQGADERMTAATVRDGVEKEREDETQTPESRDFVFLVAKRDKKSHPTQ